MKSYSFLQAANEMGSLLRECLREPFREKAIKASSIAFKQRKFVNGLDMGRTDIETMAQAFKKNIN
jgi:Mitochondrial ATP synthase epsilon chain